ncbi:TPA: phage replication protein, partial [Pseudomonas aeruginosa]
MARARNIKPGIMANEELAELSHSHRLLFIYLWMLADREGRLEDRPKRIKAEAFPYDDGLDVESMLDDLVSAGFIQRYERCGVRAVQVLNFAKHQTPHSREKASVIPAPAPVLVDGEEDAGADLGSAEGIPGTDQGGADESPSPL